MFQLHSDNFNDSFLSNLSTRQRLLPRSNVQFMFLLKLLMWNFLKSFEMTTVAECIFTIQTVIIVEFYRSWIRTVKIALTNVNVQWFNQETHMLKVQQKTRSTQNRRRASILTGRRSEMVLHKLGLTKVKMWLYCLVDIWSKKDRNDPIRANGEQLTTFLAEIPR